MIAPSTKIRKPGADWISLDEYSRDTREMICLHAAGPGMHAAGVKFNSRGRNPRIANQHDLVFTLEPLNLFPNS